MSKLVSVVLVGRINVGKSSLFNRLTETMGAITSSIAGTTRDYNLGTVAWRKRLFEVVDTGGVNIDVLKGSIQSLLQGTVNKKAAATSIIDAGIVEQTRLAIERAQVVVMIVDGQVGLLPEDRELAMVLKKLKKPVMLVANKIDNRRHEHQLSEFFSLGLGTPYPLSAANGSGVGDFLDELVRLITWPRGRPKLNVDTDAIKVALIGKPNTGKSSLVNKIVGEKRVIVSPIPHTTRDPQDTNLVYKKRTITLIDTAGLRKKARVVPGIERVSVKKSLDRAKTADVVLFITDSSEPLAKQDATLAGLLRDIGAGMVIVSNKWDLVPDKDTTTDKAVRTAYQQHLPFARFVPVVFTSATTGKNIDTLLDAVLAVHHERTKQVDPKLLEQAFEVMIKRQRPTAAKGLRHPHLYGISQVRVAPPVFAITVNKDDILQQAYLRYIENKIRERFGFEGVPMKVITREIKQ